MDLKALYPPLGRYLPDLPNLPSVDQALFLLLDNREAFYGGAAGGGKSAALLMAALQYVDIPGYNALLLRRTFPELEGADGLIAQSHEWFAPHRPEVDWNENKHRWTFPSGATIAFGHCNEERDKYQYQGQAFQFIGFDELTHFTETIYEYIGFTRARRRVALRDIGVPVRTRGASNPGGIGHAWVKSRFIDDRKDGVVFVPAKVRDNPGLDVDEYEASFIGLPEELRRQLMEGDWGAFEGAAFQLRPEHIITTKDLPRPWPLESWQGFESMDHGIAEKSATAWLTHRVDYEGNVLTWDEHYESGLLPSETAPLILRRRQMWHTSLCFGDPQSLATRTGSSRRWGDPETIETLYGDHGIPIVKGKNDPRAGYLRMRELLKLDPKHAFPAWHPRAGEPGAPRWFILEATCPELCDQLRSAPLTPVEHRFAGEMIDPRWEGPHGHALAAARYGLATWPDASTVPAEPLHPQLRWLRERERAAEAAQKETGMSYEFV